MRAEFHRPPGPVAEGQDPPADPPAVGWATWEAGRVTFDAPDERDRAALGRIMRSTPVAVDDPSLRSRGTTGPVVLQPGSLRWFRAAALARGGSEGLTVRFVPRGIDALGWEPAGAYRPFAEAIERQEGQGAEAGSLGPASDP